MKTTQPSVVQVSDNRKKYRENVEAKALNKSDFNY